MHGVISLPSLSHSTFRYDLLFCNTGFVRFTKPESVKRALKKYREFEIEIQDVSVSIKTLKNERLR